MKKILKFTILILTAGNIFFVSCKKDKPVTDVVINSPLSPLPEEPNISLATKELVLNDLTWDFDNDGAANLYIGIENLVVLLGNVSIVTVYVKSYHDTAWVTAEKFHYPNSPGYVYSVYSNSLFVFHSPHIFPWSDFNHLAGTKVSIKVKFV